MRSYLAERKPDSRYASFDYCFDYFQSFRSANARSLAERKHLQLSCLHLGFYLASWGMYRGSTSLLQKSVKCLAPVIETIASIEADVWNIDAHCYTEDNIRKLLDASKALRRAYHSGMSDALVTKIMLGVFGNVPAFDTYFKKGFQVSSFGPKALASIGTFYREHAAVIDRYRIPALTFATRKGSRTYTRAKVIDMGFFMAGQSGNR